MTVHCQRYFIGLSELAAAVVTAEMELRFHLQPAIGCIEGLPEGLGLRWPAGARCSRPWRSWPEVFAVVVLAASVQTVDVQPSCSHVNL